MKKIHFSQTSLFKLASGQLALFSENVYFSTIHRFAPNNKSLLISCQYCYFIMKSKITVIFYVTLHIGQVLFKQEDILHK